MKKYWDVIQYFFSFILFLLLTQVSHASELRLLPGVPISGRIFTDFYIPTTDTVTGGLTQTSTSLWLQANPQIGQNAVGHFVYTVDDIVASTATGSSLFQTRLREGFFEYNKSGWEVKVGKMILVWSKSDVIKPS